MRLSQKRQQKDIGFRYSNSYDISNNKEDYLTKLARNSTLFLYKSNSPSKQISYNSFIFGDGQHKKQRFRLRNLKNVDVCYYKQKNQVLQQSEENKNKNIMISTGIQLKSQYLKPSSLNQGKSPRFRNKKKHLRPSKKLNDILQADLNIYGNKYNATSPIVYLENKKKQQNQNNINQINRKQKKRKNQKNQTITSKDEGPITGWI